MHLEMSSHFILRQAQHVTRPCAAMFLYSPVWIATLLSLRFPFPLCLGLESEFLYPANGAQLEIHLVNVAEPSLPSIPCDVSPVFLDLPVVMCRTR